MIPEFVPFPKIPSYSRKAIVTEKIDGTNALVYVDEDGTVLAGSRTRWITPESDNYGFATWVRTNEEELRKLGPGRHFGEWWGQGIQRRYGLDHKRFSLFNVARWSDPEVRPACCGVVPLLWGGAFENLDTNLLMLWLQEAGSQAAPGFMKPEGIVVFHAASGQLFKRTFEHDEKGKEAA